VGTNYKEKSIKTFNNFRDKGKYKKNFDWYKKILYLLNKFKDEKYLILIFYSMVKDAIKLRYSLSNKTKTTMLITLFYIITPFDAIIDTIPFVGYIDDIFIIDFIYKVLKEEVDNYALWYYRKHKDRTD
jgi:uncharacterized membrane protein YkvA (DUF1232 family)